MREKEEVFGALPRTMTKHFSFCGIDGWSPWQRSEDSAEETRLDAH
jgi:hypothetical protein